MRRIMLWGLSTLAALVLLFSYPTSLNARPGTSLLAPATESDPSASSGSLIPATPGSGTSDSETTDSGTSDSGTTDPETTDSGTGDAEGGAAGTDGSGESGTYLGDEVMTRWGVVQVRITVSDGVITDSDAVQYPVGNSRDRQINTSVVPQLNAAVVDAQGTDIDMISGATVTIDGYLQSLQSALDQASLT